MAFWSFRPMTADAVLLDDRLYIRVEIDCRFRWFRQLREIRFSAPEKNRRTTNQQRAEVCQAPEPSTPGCRTDLHSLDLHWQWRLIKHSRVNVRALHRRVAAGAPASSLSQKSRVR